MNQNGTGDDETRGVHPRGATPLADTPPEAEADAAPQPEPEVAQTTDDDPKPRADREGGISRVFGILLVLILALAAAAAGAALGPQLHPPKADPAVAALGDRVAALEGKAGAVGDLDTRVAALETQVQALSGTGVRLDALEAGASKLTDLDQRMASVETAVAALATRVDGSLDKKLQALGDRLAQLEAGAGGATAGAADGTSSVSSDLSTLQAQVADLSRQVAALAAPAPVDLGPVTARLDSLEKRVDTLAGLTGKLADLQQQVTTLADRSVDPRAAFVLAVGQLHDAALAGGPFGDALDAARRMAPQDQAIASALATLQPLAAGGVESRTALDQGFDAVASTAIDAEQAAAATGGSWFDQTLASIEALVRVRRLDGGATGEDAAAVTSRAGAKLDDGDLAGAIAELGTLSPAAAPAAADWLAAARARLAAEQAIDDLSQRAIALISGADG